MIYTQKFREFLANTYINAINATAIPYIFVGRTLPWVDAANVSVSDSNPPKPVDTVQNTDFEFWRDMLFAKKVTANNIGFVVARRDWVSATKYDQYDDTDPSLPTKSYYVLDTVHTPYKLYKCLWNNHGGFSTTAPGSIGTPLVPTQTGDGYVWQYMYTVDDISLKTFLTSLWMPVLANSAVQANALTNAGKLPVAVPLVVTNGGDRYNPALPVSVSITGDGAGASVSANGVQIIGGKVSDIHLAIGGLGYSEVTAINVFQTGANTQASARAIIPPYPNHGYDPVKELNAKAVMFVAALSGTEANTLTVINSYRRVGLLVNPTETGGNTATATGYKQTTDITMSANTGVLMPNDIVTNITDPAKPTAAVVDVVQVASNYVVRLTNVDDNGSANGYTVGDTIKCLASGIEATVGSISGPTLMPFSGSILCVEQRKPVSRDATLNEQIKLVFPLA
jgi:hypothetical protein